MSSGCNRDYWNTSVTQIIEAIMDDNWSLEQRPKGRYNSFGTTKGDGNDVNDVVNRVI